jgi:hypothetical protein
VRKQKDTHIPVSEAEWLETGKFHIEGININGVPIRCAVVRGQECRLHTTMVGGIPREVDRQRNLPLINKLYGLLSLNLEEEGLSSLLYNQPATGGSGGQWEKETLSSRTAILAGLVNYYRKLLSASDVALIGSSAGAYMAVRAVDLIEADGGRVSKLILLSTAAYPEKIEDVPYGREFTRILHEPWDVSTSPVFAKLEKFIHGGGRVLVCFFEADDPPIPLYIQEYYRNLMHGLSHNGKDVSVLTIPGVAHNFRRLNRKRLENVVDNESIIAVARKFFQFLVS